MSAPVFVLDRARIADDRVVLDGAEGRHAATVRRLLAGEHVVLTDGHGLRADCTVVEAGPGRLELVVDARTETPQPQPRLVVVQALPKGDRGELAVATMTEVGVDVIVPWAAARCITRWSDARGDKALQRWRTTVREAAKQSRRSRFPEVAELATTEGVTALLASAAMPVVLHEDGDVALSSVDVPSDGDVVVVVGPEGGITPEELTAFATAGATAYRLGPTVLRTSTAGPAALAVLLARTARWAT
ncbi:MAG: 16S rRNA (uracil(1498)-N(3))-methyltransferase [Sporichthyaceae bacterium]